VARTDYDKLVRDLIPDIIQRDRHSCAIETLSDEAFRRALRDKLVEETQEAATAPDEDLATELADLQEVFDTLLATYGLSREAVVEIQQARRAQRGGFTRCLRLLWTE
jgi:predicted house-cleaning noncanonical NTP pyrophosphatase (MazG superfamily)